MSVPAAYMGVIIIWSTTPLAVQWSTGSFSPLGAVAVRLSLAWMLVLVLSMLLRSPSLALRKHWKLYASASLGLFPNLVLLNGAAHYISSGLISVMFGLSPLMVGLLASYLLGDKRLTSTQFAALGLALMGLGVIFAEHMQLGAGALRGIVLMVSSVFLFSLSSVLVKRYAGDHHTHALTQLRGSLMFALPGVMLCWLVMDGAMPNAVTLQSASAVVYLGVVGSLLGVWAYFYLLTRMNMGLISIIPLITPVFALLLGASINEEPLSLQLLVGASLILAGLALFNRAPKIRPPDSSP